jgi:hypothetical protein
MPFIGNKPSAVPLTSADIADGIITSAKIVDGTIVNADINASAAIDSTKLSGVQGKFESALLHVRDEKANGTNGGTFTNGAWQTRTLNTSLTNQISGASLSSNQITLPSGTYYIHASAPAYSIDRHKLKLRNTTDSSDTLIGTSEQGENAYAGFNRSFVIGRFTIAAQKTFELQHRCTTTISTNGFGLSSTWSGEIEVYTDVQIWKVA